MSLENYTVGKAIGQGHFSVVYKAKDNISRSLVALKKINIFEMSRDAREKCLKEVELLKSVDHPNIIKYMENFIADNDLVIVCEYAEMGDLANLIKRHYQAGQSLDEASVWKYFSQVASAVKHMHDRRIMHRDLKPSNVFVTAAGIVKVGDLGLGRELHESGEKYAHSRVGTPLYMAPEVFQSARGYNFSSDLWSLGCLLYELACGVSPFKEEGMSFVELVRRMKALQYKEIPDKYSKTLHDLVKRLLVIEPKERMPVGEVAAIAETMAHKFASPAETADNSAFVLADELHDKLQILGYEAVCRKAGVPPIPAINFAISMKQTTAQATQASAQQQWHVFIRLAIWLAREGNIKVPIVPTESPPVVAEQLARAAAAAGVEVPAKGLQSPYGPAACLALTALADAALTARKVVFRPVVIKESAAILDSADDVVGDDNDNGEEDIATAISDDEDTTGTDPTAMSSSIQEEHILSGMDIDTAAAWRLEVERVTPLLAVPPVAKSWRGSVTTMTQTLDTISGTVTETRTGLRQISADIRDELIQQSSSERNLADRLSALIDLRRGKQDECNRVSEQFRQTTGVVDALSNELQNLNDNVDEIKSKLDQRGSEMSESGGLVEIRKAVKNLQSEIATLDVRIGVANGRLFHIYQRKQ
eukprot:TRINITY_DN10516_c0_g1_i1.p1 TRINITY_DN10516_c0_g1~~TRINITY_DN10516_c0_g1_i1.p1  ORF type:complete len:649 (-),score=138.75 TRINITY_DN10516_c0_g1_i1:120-2066(-)